MLANRFELGSLLGEGAMARVFDGRDLHTGQRVAIKVLREVFALQSEGATRLRREAEVLAKLNHPTIVGFHHFGALPSGQMFLAMEYLSGETLLTLVEKAPVDVATLTPVVTGVCAGLAAAHRAGVIHRDLKPANIFLLSDKAREEHGVNVKILDFGISKAFDLDNLTRTGQVLGTPRYMSPEQLGAESDIDARIDLYSVGVMLYEALSGKPPFAGRNATDLLVNILRGAATDLKEHRPDLPQELTDLVMRSMHRDRKMRPESAIALAEAWLSAIPQQPVYQASNHKKTSVLGSFAENGMQSEGDGSKRISGVGPTLVGGFSAVPHDLATSPAKRAEAMTRADMQNAGNVSKKTRAMGQVEIGNLEARAHALGLANAETMEPLPPTSSRKEAAAHPRPVRAFPAAGPVQLNTVYETSEAAQAQQIPVEPVAAKLETTRAPRRLSTWLLVLGSLVLGAATTVGVFWAIGMVDFSSETPEVISGPPQSIAGNSTTDNDNIELDATSSADPNRIVGDRPPPIVGMNTPNIEEPPSSQADSLVAGEALPEPPHTHHIRRERQNMRPSRPSGRRLAEVVRDARSALDAGNTPRCLELVVPISGRSEEALFLHAECLRRSGQLGSATSRYERYCQQFPSGRHIATVRRRVIAAGGRCGSTGILN